MKYDVILALGRGISEQGVLPDVSAETVKRVGLLFGEGVADKVVFCGKWSRHYKYTPPTTEAEAMEKLALDLGIAKDKIILEKDSLDTISNLYFAKKKIVQPNNWRKILLLTLSKNDKRALITAKYIFGPDFEVESQSIDYKFAQEKLIQFEKIEEKKVEILETFFKEHNINPGDDEKIYQEHLGYINSHEIPPTFSSS